MRVAILLQGEPRFCSEFDLFLQNLVGFDRADWFMYLWKDSPSTSNLLSSEGHQVVAPCWQHIERDWALNKFRELFPSNHSIITLELADQTTVPMYNITENFAVESIQSNVWKMWYSQHMANKLRTDYENSQNFKYDVVIKARPDISLESHLDVTYMRKHFDGESNLVLMSQNKRCGYGVMISDLIGISTSNNMTTYTNLYNEAVDHHRSGTIFHPETMLARHLEHHGLKYAPADFKIEFRRNGIWRDVTTGEEWKSPFVPSWSNKIYISDFGRWA